MTRALTLQEAAAELHKTARWLRDWVKNHPVDEHGEPYCTPVGRDRIFEVSDVSRIKLALRGKIQCHSDLGRRAPAKRRTSKSGAQSGDQTDLSAWKRAAELLNDPTLSSSPDGSKSASRSTDAGPRLRLRVIEGTTS